MKLSIHDTRSTLSRCDLLTSWRGRLQGGLLLAASLETSVWLLICAFNAADGYSYSLALQVAEIFSKFLWIVFSVKLLAVSRPVERTQRLFRTFMAAAIVVGLALVGLNIARKAVFGKFPIFGSDAIVLGYIVLSVLGLVLVEQLFRNVRPERRWAIKYLCLGLGGIFAYDFFMYSDMLLLKGIDTSLWIARGGVIAFLPP